MAAEHQIKETQAKVVAESEKELMEIIPEAGIEVPANNPATPKEGKDSEPNSELDSVVASILESIGVVEASGGGSAGVEEAVDKVEGDGTSGGGTTEVSDEKKGNEVVVTSEKDTLVKEDAVVKAKPINTVERSDSLDEWFDDDDEVQVVAETLRTMTPGKKRKGPAMSVRFQPPRSGKKQKASAKKDRELTVHEPAESEQKPKHLLEEFEISGEWFLTHRLEDVWDLIKFQKWEHLFEAEGSVDTNEVLEFYKKITKVQRGAFVYLTFEFRGQELMISSVELATILGLDHEGYDVFAKGSWPDEITESLKEAMQLRVCNTSDLTKTSLTTTQMEPRIKILHKLLVTTFLPRGSKPSLAQIHDILVLDQIIQRRKVNLPKLIMHQIEYISKFNNVGYARIVKKILQFQMVYSPQVEVVVTKPLDLNVFHRLGLELDADEGWRRKVTEVIEEEPHEVKPVGDGSLEERLAKIEAEIGGIKSELKTMATNL